MKRLFYVSVVMSCVLGLVVTPSRAQTCRGSGSGHPYECEYKSIAVPTENGKNQKLSRLYDLTRIASAMRLKRAYEVSDRYNGNGVVISRTFSGVKYNLIFENRDGVSGFNLNTYNFKGYPGRLTVAWGEKCSTPSHLIKKKVYRMIDDLPLDAQQKEELKQYVVVTNVLHARLF